MSSQQKKRGQVVWYGDPLSDIAQAFQNLWPHKSANICIQPLESMQGKRTKRRIFGHTRWTRGAHPQVYVEIRQPYIGIMDILSHELAHVAAGYKAAHGPKWRKAYRAIHEEYERIVDSSNDQMPGAESRLVSIDDGLPRRRKS